MPSKKRRRLPQNPLLVGLAAVVAILLITSTSFSTPLVPFNGFGGEYAALSFSIVGVLLLGILVLFVFVRGVKK